MHKKLDIIKRDAHYQRQTRHSLNVHSITQLISPLLCWICNCADRIIKHGTHQVWNNSWCSVSSNVDRFVCKLKALCAQNSLTDTGPLSRSIGSDNLRVMEMRVWRCQSLTERLCIYRYIPPHAITHSEETALQALTIRLPQMETKRADLSWEKKLAGDLRI